MDKKAFTDKVLESEETLYRISRSILRNEQDCEDAVQDAILTAYSKLSTLKNEEYFKTWLVRILINKCNQRLKQRKRLLSAEVLPEQTNDTLGSGAEVRMAIEQLNPKIRVVVVMKYIEGFSVKEIKDVLKIPEGTVKSRLSKGREELKKKLEINTD